MNIRQFRKTDSFEKNAFLLFTNVDPDQQSDLSHAQWGQLTLIG